MLHHIIETIHYELADGTRYLSIDGIFQSYKNVRNNFVAIVYVLIMIFGISFSTVLSLLSNEYSRTAKPILSKHYDVEKNMYIQTLFAAPIAVISTSQTGGHC